jgi:hypothetical protein
MLVSEARGPMPLFPVATVDTLIDATLNPFFLDS